MSIIFYVFIFMTYFQTVHVHILYICNMVLLNEKIKKLRIQKNISQVDMANAAGMSRGAFIAFENGKESVNLSLRAAIEIAKTLNISFNDLFEIEAPAAAGSVDESLLKEKIADLQKQIEQKDLTIQTLIANRKFFISTLVKYFENIDEYTFYWMAIQGYKYAKTEKQKEYVELQIKVAEKQREGMYDYFLNEGMITKNEIEQAQKSIKEFYDRMDYESSFKRQFENITDNMIEFNSMLEEQKENK